MSSRLLGFGFRLCLWLGPLTIASHSLLAQHFQGHAGHGHAGHQLSQQGLTAGQRLDAAGYGRGHGYGQTKPGDFGHGHTGMGQAGVGNFRATGSAIYPFGATRTLAGNISATGAFSLTLGGTTGDALNYTGVMSDGTGTLSVVIRSLITLTATSTFTGTVSISGGTLELGNNGGAGSLTGASSMEISEAGTLVFANSDNYYVGIFEWQTRHGKFISGIQTYCMGHFFFQRINFCHIAIYANDFMTLNG